MHKWDNLTKARMRVGLTYDGAAKVLGIDRDEYFKYENSTLEPSLEMLCKIADAFDVSTDYLLGRTAISSMAQEEAPLYNETHYTLLHKYSMLREGDQSAVRTLIDNYLSE